MIKGNNHTCFEDRNTVKNNTRKLAQLMLLFISNSPILPRPLGKRKIICKRPLTPSGISSFWSPFPPDSVALRGIFSGTTQYAFKSRNLEIS